MGGFVRLCMYGVLAAFAFVLDVQFLKDSLMQSSRLAHREMAASTTTTPTTPESNDITLQDDDGNRETVAILIAGQCHRFVYRDQSGPLFRGPANDTKPAYAIDVYIALQCGEIVPSFIGTVDSPPYMESWNISDIEGWYMERGARSVTVQVIDTNTVDDMFHDITHQATTYARRMDTFKLEEVPCWNAEVRKFYMRHYAFSMAQKGSTHKYDSYVFNREDNHFLTPLDMDDIFFSKNKSKDEPFVIVDKHCEFGAYSDKMYIANHLGASIVFSSTKSEFMSWMKRFIMIGLLQKRHAYWRPYQAEAFVQDTLKSADVERIDLMRVDLRYRKGTRCVPQQYFYCMSNETQELAYAQNLVTCESLW